MSTFLAVNPLSTVNVNAGTPAFGRGAWVKEGIGFDYRYALNPDGSSRIGTVAEKSLAHWAVAAGCWAIQKRLITLGKMASIGDTEKGIFGPKTQAAVKLFQGTGVDPENDTPLEVDGTVGRSDARALFTPLIKAVESRYSIPSSFLLGETNHESRLDPGAVGYYIFYPDYRGVDRGMSQINSKYNEIVTWGEAFNPEFSLDWSGKRLRKAHDDYKAKFPSQIDAILWDAALCNHNNPSAALQWAKTGYAPTEVAARYVADTKAARY